jgi:hypothetical protein
MLPVMEERRKLWHDHNSLKSIRPMLVMEMDTFEDCILPLSKCESSAAVEIERELNKWIINHEMINDDKVVPEYYSVYWKIDINEFGLNIQAEHAKDSRGRELGYKTHYPILDLKADYGKIGSSIYSADKDYTLAWKTFVEDIIGDILPVRIKNKSLYWYVAPSQKAVNLMGLETMMYSMVDYPEEFHKLYGFLKEDIINFVKWQEKENLLILNNGNDYAGAGSYGFINELPSEACKKTGNITTKDLWVNMNSQETVGISPEMFNEYIFPYYFELAKEFGLVYYGCCEPVHRIWESCISKLPNLRKVSISPWCDEEYMGNILRDSKVIYSRKPSPNYIGAYEIFDEDAFTEHIKRTLLASRGCKVEIIFRDIYNLFNDRKRPEKAIMIARKLIEKVW